MEMPIDMRRTYATLALLAGLLSGVAVTAWADDKRAVDVRLTGKFRSFGQIVSSNFAREGQTRKRTYEFTPLCPAGPCEKVVFKRQIPRQEFVRSTLHEAAPGIYVGVERITDAICPDDFSEHGRQTARHRIEIVAGDLAGEATDIKGKSRFRIRGCDKKFHQRARYYGDRIG